MATLEFTAGRLYHRLLRDYLNQAKFKGYIEDFIESGGWITHVFTVKGSPKYLSLIRDDLQKKMSADSD